MLMFKVVNIYAAVSMDSTREYMQEILTKLQLDSEPLFISLSEYLHNPCLYPHICTIYIIRIVLIENMPFNKLMMCQNPMSCSGGV